jgi:putative FmdB family regulatory protein
MGLVRKIRSLLGASEKSLYDYKCNECGHEFEAAVTNPNETNCPECGSGMIHTSLRE